MGKVIFRLLERYFQLQFDTFFSQSSLFLLCYSFGLLLRGHIYGGNYAEEHCTDVFAQRIHVGFVSTHGLQQRPCQIPKQIREKFQWTGRHLCRFWWKIPIFVHWRPAGRRLLVGSQKAEPSAPIQIQETTTLRPSLFGPHGNLCLCPVVRHFYAVSSTTSHFCQSVEL